MWEKGRRPLPRSIKSKTKPTMSTRSSRRGTSTSSSAGTSRSSSRGGPPRGTITRGTTSRPAPESPAPGPTSPTPGSPAPEIPVRPTYTPTPTGAAPAGVPATAAVVPVKTSPQRRPPTPAYIPTKPDTGLPIKSAYVPPPAVSIDSKDIRNYVRYSGPDPVLSPIRSTVGDSTFTQTYYIPPKPILSPTKQAGLGGAVDFLSDNALYVLGTLGVAALIRHFRERA